MNQWMYLNETKWMFTYIWLASCDTFLQKNKTLVQTTQTFSPIYLFLWRHRVRIQMGQRAVDSQDQTEGHQASQLHLVLTEVHSLNVTIFCKDLGQRHGTFTRRKEEEMRN